MLIFVLLTFQVVSSLGVTQPILEKETMLKGENSRFYFEIQAMGVSTKQSCACSFSGLDPLQVTLNETTPLVDANTIKKIYGTVSVPSNVELKTYTGKLIVSCQPYEETGGGSSIKRTTNVPFVVNIVESIEKRTEQKLPEPEQKSSISLLPIFIIIILVILVICIVYWFNKKKK